MHWASNRPDRTGSHKTALNFRRSIDSMMRNTPSIPLFSYLVFGQMGFSASDQGTLASRLQ